MTSSSRNTPVSYDITKLVRQSYKPPPLKPYRHEKVKCRTTNNCKTNTKDNAWHVHYTRRLANLEKGFQSSISEAYKPVGGQPILDPYELVISALPCQPDQKDQVPQPLKKYTQEPKKKTSNSSSVSDKTQSDHDQSVEVFELVDTCPTGGYENISQYLHECRLRAIAVRGGVPYEEHVKLMEEKRQLEQALNKPGEDAYMILPSISTGIVSSAAEAKSDAENLTPVPGLIMEEYCISDEGSKRCTPSPLRRRVLSSSMRQRSTASPRSPGSNRIKLIKVSSGIGEAFDRRDRLYRDHLNYLKAVFDILMSLSNMRNRDLRSKVPLGKEYVRHIKKEIKHFSTDFERSSRGTAICQVRGNHDNMDFPENSLRDHAGGGISEIKMFNMSKRMTTVDNVNNKFQWGGGTAGRRRSRVQSEGNKDRLLVETWEDLLNVQTQEYKEEASPSPSFSVQAGLVSKFMRWFRKASVTPSQNVDQKQQAQGVDKEKLNTQLESLRDKREGAPHILKAESRIDGRDRESYQQPHFGSAAGHSERTRRFPIWQQVAQEKSTVFTTNKKKKSKTKDPNTTVLRCRHDLYKLKQTLQKENNAEMEKLERKRVANFHLKFDCLDSEKCHPVLEQQMIAIHCATDNVDKAHLENFAIQPSKWYEKLKAETMNLISTFPNTEIMDTIQQMHRFSHTDNKTVPYAKAKLCLLMMSMPGYDICKIHQQQALKFVLEDILLGLEAQFEEWLSERKIPNVLFKS